MYQMPVNNEVAPIGGYRRRRFGAYERDRHRRNDFTRSGKGVKYGAGGRQRSHASNKI